VVHSEWMSRAVSVFQHRARIVPRRDSQLVVSSAGSATAVSVR
jgi:hypothetical protein